MIIVVKTDVREELGTIVRVDPGLRSAEIFRQIAHQLGFGEEEPAEEGAKPRPLNLIRLHLDRATGKHLKQGYVRSGASMQENDIYLLERKGKKKKKKKKKNGIKGEESSTSSSSCRSGSQPKLAAKRMLPFGRRDSGNSAAAAAAITTITTAAATADDGDDDEEEEEVPDLDVMEGDDDDDEEDRATTEDDNDENNSASSLGRTKRKRKTPRRLVDYACAGESTAHNKRMKVGGGGGSTTGHALAAGASAAAAVTPSTVVSSSKNGNGSSSNNKTAKAVPSVVGSGGGGSKNGGTGKRWKPYKKLTKEQRDELRGHVLELDDLEHYLRAYEGAGDRNVRYVLRQVKALQSGDGVRYSNWAEGVSFLKGQPLSADLGDDDYDEVREIAIAFEDTYGQDKGHGWLLRHPLKKLANYQAYYYHVKLHHDDPNRNVQIRGGAGANMIYAGQGVKEEDIDDENGNLDAEDDDDDGGLTESEDEDGGGTTNKYASINSKEQRQKQATAAIAISKTKTASATVTPPKSGSQKPQPHPPIVAIDKKQVLTEEQRKELRAVPLNMEDFETYLRTIEGNSEKNVKSCLRQVRKLRAGEGIAYNIVWGDGVVFCRDRPVTDMSMNFTKLKQSAAEFEQVHGRDKSRGWLLKLPIAKLENYQNFLFHNRHHALGCGGGGGGGTAAPQRKSSAAAVDDRGSDDNDGSGNESDSFEELSFAGIDYDSSDEEDGGDGDNDSSSKRDIPLLNSVEREQLADIPLDVNKFTTYLSETLDDKYVQYIVKQVRKMMAGGGGIRSTKLWGAKAVFMKGRPIRSMGEDFYRLRTKDAVEFVKRYGNNSPLYGGRHHLDGGSKLLKLPIKKLEHYQAHLYQKRQEEESAQRKQRELLQQKQKRSFVMNEEDYLATAE